MQTVHPKVARYLQQKPHIVTDLLVKNGKDICTRLLYIEEYCEEISLYQIGNSLEQSVLYQEGYDPETTEPFTLSPRQLAGALKGNLTITNNP